MHRLLVGSDFHLGPLGAAFEERLSEDVIPLFLGDLVNRPGDDAPAFWEITERWRAQNDELVVVPGNHDPEPAGDWEGVQLHHRRGLTILAVPVIRILYKFPTWTHEYSEERIEAMLDPFRGQAVDVIASHGPPHGVCDRGADGRALGSHALRAFGEATPFRLWVCGHVHEQRGARGLLAGRPVYNTARTIFDLLVAPGTDASAYPEPR